MSVECFPMTVVPHVSQIYRDFLAMADSADDAPVRQWYGAEPFAGRWIHSGSAAGDAAPSAHALADLLERQSIKFGASESAMANIAKLRAGARAVVTGQQVVLFGGPLLTILKAATAVARAKEATAATGIDHVPVFWLATEDHDLAEVNHVFWNTRNGLARHELPAREEDTGRHVGEVVLGDAIQSIVTTAVETLEGPFADEVGRALRESYAPGETYGSAFGKLMSRLLAGKGIIFIDPLDARLHRLAAHVYLRALDESDSLRDALLARSQELEAAGYHVQVKVTHETTLLFYKVGGRREPLRSRNGKFIAADSEFSREELASAIEKTPEAFTPSALLRPVVQDTLLPTAAYIGGPAEIAYMAQTQVAYAKILGRMPAILPRASFTIVEQPIARFLAHYGLDVRDFLRGSQHVRAMMEQKALPGGLASRFDATERTLRDLLKTYEEPLEKLDPTLIEALRAMEGKVLHQFGQLRAKAGRAENLRSGVLDRKERILLDSLYPQGGLQERSLCFLPLLAASGRELLDELSRLSSLGGSAAGHACSYQHQVLVL
jgi:bacillithiol synthase